MTWRELIAQMMRWPGWRRHAPAAGAAVAHVALFGMIGSMMASAAPERAQMPPERVIVLDLTPELPPEPMAGVTPPPRAKAPVSTERKGETPATPVQPRGPVQPVPATPEASADEDSVYLGPPTPQGLAKGLASLMGDDPCTVVRLDARPDGCAGQDLAARIGRVDTLLPQTPEQVAQFHGAYMEKCILHTGCDGGEWISTNGTRSVGRAGPAGDRGAPTPMAAGASSLGGLNDSVGRLPPRRDQVDPGFGD